jgi:hypothetical protein
MCRIERNGERLCLGRAMTFRSRNCCCCDAWKLKLLLKLKLNYDRQSVGQSVLVSGTHLGPVTIFFFLLEVFFRQLRVCYFVAPSLTRGPVCNLRLLLVLASLVPRESRPYFIFPILETPPTWRAMSRYLYPPGTGRPRYTPSPLATRRATVEVFCPACTRECAWRKTLNNLICCLLLT